MMGRSLAMRDPARAAIFGVRHNNGQKFGSDFGRDYGNFGAGYGSPSNFGRDYPQFGDDNMHPAEQQAVLKAHARKQQVTRARLNLLEPNEDSEVKVQRYVLAMLLGAVTLGTPGPLSGSQAPSTRFRAQRVTVNAPEPGFAEIATIQIANVNAIVGGTMDAFDLNANAVDAFLDLPTIPAAIPVTISGTYLGDSAGRTGTYNIRASLRGPSNVAG